MAKIRPFRAWRYNLQDGSAIEEYTSPLFDVASERQIETLRQNALNSIHLTLKFLGNIATDRTGEITKVMEEASQTVSPFHLEVSGLGVFPNLKRVQVVWVGISGEVAKLDQLQQRIESNLARLGFGPESRPFTSHLTLARLRNQASLDERQRFGQLITSTKFEAVHGIKVDTISLMKSHLTREGAIHSRISSVRLKKPLSTPNT